MQVASHFYSYSFELNPNWTRKFALQPEIITYFRSIAEKHDVPRRIIFRSIVHKAEFDERTGTWLVTILDQKTGEIYQKRARVLVSAVGALSVPKECEIKGAEKYRGTMFHSAKWDHGFDWTEKEVVVVGMFLIYIVKRCPVRIYGNTDGYDLKETGAARRNSCLS